MTEKNNLVSIIVPIYNAERFLDRCINSIVLQTYQNIELLLIDDGSTDSSAKICMSWANKDKRIKYYYQNNAGVSAARNLGLETYTGEYLMFVDADDYVDVNCVQKLVSEMDEDIEVVISNAQNINADGTVRKSFSKCKQNTILTGSESVAEFLKHELFFETCWGRLYRRSSVGEIRFDKTMRIAEDGKFLWTVLNNVSKVKVIPDCVYSYCINDGSVVHSGFNEKYFDEIKFSEELVDIYKGSGELETLAYTKLFSFILRLLCMNGVKRATYKSLCLKEKQVYPKIKSKISTKDKIRYYLLSNLMTRKLYMGYIYLRTKI